MLDIKSIKFNRLNIKLAYQRLLNNNIIQLFFKEKISRITELQIRNKNKNK